MDRIVEILVGNFGFDIKLALFSVINFIVVFVILKKLIFEKLDKTISQRKQNIEEGLQNFELAKEKLEQAVNESKIIIDDAKLDAAKIIEESYKKAEEVAQSVKQNTLKDVDSMMQKAREDAKQLEIKMRQELRKETVELVLTVTDKLLRDRVDVDIDRSLVEGSMNGLDIPNIKN